MKVLLDPIHRIETALCSKQKQENTVALWVKKVRTTSLLEPQNKKHPMNVLINSVRMNAKASGFYPRTESYVNTINRKIEDITLPSPYPYWYWMV